MTSDICSDPKSSSECVLTGCDVPQDQDDGWPAVGDGGERNGASHPVPGFRSSKRVSRLGQTASKWCKRAYAVESLSAGAGRLSESGRFATEEGKNLEYHSLTVCGPLQRRGTADSQKVGSMQAAAVVAGLVQVLGLAALCARCSGC